MEPILSEEDENIKEATDVWGRRTKKWNMEINAPTLEKAVLFFQALRDNNDIPMDDRQMYQFALTVMEGAVHEGILNDNGMFGSFPRSIDEILRH